MATPSADPAAGKADFAIVGLGKIGGNLARQALQKRLRVAGFSRSGAPPNLRAMGLIEAQRLEDLRELLKPPRVVLLYVPAGEAVDGVLESLLPVLERGDVVVDGGNSYWGDSQRRHQRLAGAGLRFVDAGTSGGIEGALRGACFMVGGDADAVGIVEPLLRPLAVEGGFVHAGAAGAGHFTKLVHNGIEFGMLQAIGEGVALLERHPDGLPVQKILQAWRHGSVIRSWLVDLMANKHGDESGLDHVPPLVEDTGEVNWLLQDALRLEVPVPVIAQAVQQLVASRDQRGDAARAVAMMRRAFGGHPYGADEDIARERHESRVGDFKDPGADES
jgi:6-phosphogluconate dehydrogenase